MRINILVSDENVHKVRSLASEFMPFSRYLHIPVSESGELPATHWFCTFETSQAVCEKLMGMANLSDMATGDDKEFLESKNMKRISNASGK